MAEKKERPKEELERVVIEDVDKLVGQFLDMSSDEGREKDLQETLTDMQEQCTILQSKINRIVAARQEASAQFWADVRKQHKDWFREMRVEKMCIHAEPLKHEGDTRTIGLKLIAHDARRDVLGHIREIFRPGTFGDSPDGERDGSED
jgi:hypothetical protein